jgi:four helix bundle protein
MKEYKKNDLEERLFSFVVKVLMYLRTVKTTEETKIIKYQLTKSSTSSGANFEEAQGCSTRADFSSKISISLKEMRESNYWLRILHSLELGDKSLAKELVNESEELKKILGSISSKVSKSLKKK